MEHTQRQEVKTPLTKDKESVAYLSKVDVSWSEEMLSELCARLTEACMLPRNPVRLSADAREQVLLLERRLRCTLACVRQKTLTPAEGAWQVVYSVCYTLRQLKRQKAYRYLLARTLYTGLHLGDRGAAGASLALSSMQVAIEHARQAMYQALFADVPSAVSFAECETSDYQWRRVQQYALQTELLTGAGMPDVRVDQCYGRLLQRKFFSLNACILWLRCIGRQQHKYGDVLLALRDVLFAKTCRYWVIGGQFSVSARWLCYLSKLSAGVKACVTQVERNYLADNATIKLEAAALRRAIAACRKQLLPFIHLRRFFGFVVSALFVSFGTLLGLFIGILITGFTLGADGAHSALYGLLLGGTLFAGMDWRLRKRHARSAKHMTHLFLSSLL